MRNALRFASLLALAASALSAHATDIQFSTSGSFIVDASGLPYWGEQVRIQSTGPSISEFYASPDDLAKGQLRFYGNSGDLWLNIVKRSTTDLGDGQFVDFGTWTIDTRRSTLGWVNLAGGGVWSTSRMKDAFQEFPGRTTRYTAGTSWVGRYGPAPVPEPASMAALGLGVAALLRRRKRA